MESWGCVCVSPYIYIGLGQLRCVCLCVCLCVRACPWPQYLAKPTSSTWALYPHHVCPSHRPWSLCSHATLLSPRALESWSLTLQTDEL